MPNKTYSFLCIIYLCLKNMFPPLHNIFMPNKIYLYLCMIIMPTENAMKLIELPKYIRLNNIFMANEIYLYHGRIYL